jgi:site-specific recombinase XerD
MLIHVQYLLEHKSVMNTERYTHLVDFGNDKYCSAVAKTHEKVKRLAEDGWT